MTSGTSNIPDLKEPLFAPDAKKVMSSFDLQAIAGELRVQITGARIDNIYQFSPLAFLLTFHPLASLVMEAGRRVNLTRYEIERPGAPSQFCSILRRHLRQGTVDEVGVEDFERVLFLKVSSKEGIRRLVVEVFGGGNVLLLDDKDTIIQALTYRRMRDRSILRGETYRLPPQRGLSPDQTSLPQLLSMRDQKHDIARAIGRTLSLGSPYVEEILLRARAEKTLMAPNLTDDQIRSIHEAVQSLIEDLKQPHPRIIVREPDGWVDAIPFPLLVYGKMGSIEFETYNEAADLYFTTLSTRLEGAEQVAGSEAQVEEQKRILKQQRERLEELEKEASESQRTGELLYVHFSEVQNILDLLGKTKEEPEKVADRIVSFDPSLRKVKISLEDRKIDLDLRKSVHENARTYFQQAKDARQKMEGLRKAIGDAEKKLEVRELERTKPETRLPRPTRRRAWYEKFHWVKTKNGVIVAGRDAITNEILIKKHMEPKDLVFHTESPGAPFVLVKSRNGEMSQEEMMEAAQMAASYSSAWKAGLSSTDTYWVRPEQVSKTAPSGEYLTRGAFMIRGQKNYIKGVQLRASIGIVESDEVPEVIGGPPSAVKIQAKVSMDIVPGRKSSGALAKEIRRKLATMRPELSRQISAVPLEEIQRFIPPGGGEMADR